MFALHPMQELHAPRNVAKQITDQQAQKKLQIENALDHIFQSERNNIKNTSFIKLKSSYKHG
jgi:hypothetical protein